MRLFSRRILGVSVLTLLFVALWLLVPNKPEAKASPSGATFYSNSNGTAENWTYISEGTNTWTFNFTLDITAGAYTPYSIKYYARNHTAENGYGWELLGTDSVSTSGMHSKSFTVSKTTDNAGAQVTEAMWNHTGRHSEVRVTVYDNGNPGLPQLLADITMDVYITVYHHPYILINGGFYTLVTSPDDSDKYRFTLYIQDSHSHYVIGGSNGTDYATASVWDLSLNSGQGDWSAMYMYSDFFGWLSVWGEYWPYNHNLLTWQCDITKSGETGVDITLGNGLYYRSRLAVGSSYIDLEGYAYLTGQ